MVRQKQAPEKKVTVAPADGEHRPKKVVKAPRTVIRGSIPAGKPTAAATAKLVSVPEETKKPKRVYAHTGMEGIRKATLKRLLQKGGSLRVAKVNFAFCKILP